jgi:hypothetical protein
MKGITYHTGTCARRLPGWPAVWSPNREYRYVLWRAWSDDRPSAPIPFISSTLYVAFIGLNPSTADETFDDPTVRRCVGYASRWGYRAMCMLNIFAFRSTDPAALRKAYNPVGPDNDYWLQHITRTSLLTVAAWGVHGTLNGREEAVRGILPKLTYLRLTKDGHPSHPLYLPNRLEPKPWLLRRNEPEDGV